MAIFLEIFSKGSDLLSNISAVSISLLAIFCAIMIIVSRHPVHSILYLVGVFFCISAHYILLNAQFLAVINIIVYAGAIMVLFLFVVMLMNLNKSLNKRHYLLLRRGPAIVLSVVFSLVLLGLFYSKVNTVSKYQEVLSSGNIGLTQSISKILFNEYALPFELTALLFLTAVMAGVILARKSKQINNSQ